MQPANRVTEEELNASLPERFARASLGRSASHPTASDTIPSAPASNNEIREYYELLNRPVTGGAWLTRPEIPNSADILRTEAAEFTDADPTLIEVESGLRPHKVEGPYQDKDEYLGTKYELLREDALRPFREAVAEVRASPFKDEAEYENKSLGVYDPVYITGLVFSNRGLATRVAFSLARVKKHIR
jgi:helicase required for RNAi-mediated heterochromatin assembly 1